MRRRALVAASLRRFRQANWAALPGGYPPGVRCREKIVPGDRRPEAYERYQGLVNVEGDAPASV